MASIEIMPPDHRPVHYVENILKKLLVACFITLASIAATATPSMADSVTVTIGDSHHGDRWNRHHHNDWRRHHYRQRHHVRHCRMKPVRYHRHGRVVFTKKRVCYWS